MHEMRTECAETKVAAESKFAEAHRLIGEAQEKFTDAEAKLRAAESLQAEATRYNNIAERKLHDVEAREDNLRRQMISFKSEYVNFTMIVNVNLYDLEHVGTRHRLGCSEMFALGVPSIS